MDQRRTNGSLEVVRKSPLFFDLPVLALRDLNDLAIHCHYHRKEFICHQGDLVTKLRMIYSGRAKYSYSTSTGERLLLGWLDCGAAFTLGAFATIPTTERFTVEAIEECETLEWSAPTIKALSARFPGLITNAVSNIGVYLDHTLGRMHRMLTESAPDRVAHVVDTAAREIGRVTSGDTEVVISDEEIAEMANTTLFTVSRLIQQWSRLGLLVKSRGKILIPGGCSIYDHMKQSGFSNEDRVAVVL